MTVYHYIASSREIPTGDYGTKAKIVPISNIADIEIKGIKPIKRKTNKYRNNTKLNEQNVIVYETEEDYQGIAVSELDGYDEIRTQFTHPYVYHLHCSDHRNAYSALFKYIDENLLEGESIELYTCWAGDELKEKVDSLNIVVNLETKQFQNDIGNFKLHEKRLFNDLSERFSFRERQYVLVTK
ncbi:hypothetical protein [Anaerosporobacter sp.]